MAEPAPLICRDIHKTFNKLEVLKGISLETRKGDVVSLIGSSGSGKSTFLRCINPDSYTHLRAHETKANLVCRLLLEKKKKRSGKTG